MILDMHMADTRENALKACDKFIETFGAKYERVVENMKKYRDDLFQFYNYPAEHSYKELKSDRVHLCDGLLRHNTTKGNGTAKAPEAMALNSASRQKMASGD